MKNRTKRPFKTSRKKEVIVVRKRPLAQKVKTPPPQPKEHYLDNIPKSFKKYVYKHIDKLMPPIPWAVGIRDELTAIMTAMPEYDGKKTKLKKLIRWKIKMVSKSDPYLKALIHCDYRHGFNGKLYPIEEMHRQVAANYLKLKEKKRLKYESNAKNNRPVKKNGAQVRDRRAVHS